MATPMLAPTCRLRPSTAMGWCSASMMRRPIRCGSSGDTSLSSMTRNSSPPRRATVSPSRTARPRRWATMRRTSSPARCPSWSFTSLKPSRSMNSSATAPPWSRTRASERSSWQWNAARLNRPVSESWLARYCCWRAIWIFAETSCTSAMIEVTRPEASVSAELNHSPWISAPSRRTKHVSARFCDSSPTCRRRRAKPRRSSDAPSSCGSEQPTSGDTCSHPMSCTARREQCSRRSSWSISITASGLLSMCEDSRWLASRRAFMVTCNSCTSSAVVMKPSISPSALRAGVRQMVRHSSTPSGLHSRRWYCTRSPCSTRFTKGMKRAQSCSPYSSCSDLPTTYSSCAPNQRAYSSLA